MGFHAHGSVVCMADLSVFLSFYSVLMGIMPTPFDRFIGHVAVLLLSGWVLSALLVGLFILLFFCYGFSSFVRCYFVRWFVRCSCVLFALTY